MEMLLKARVAVTEKLFLPYSVFIFGTSIVELLFLVFCLCAILLKQFVNESHTLFRRQSNTTVLTCFIIEFSLGGICRPVLGLIFGFIFCYAAPFFVSD